MSEPINNIIDVEVTISSAGLGGADLGVPCFFYGNAQDESELGFNEFSRPSEVREMFPGKTDLIEQVEAWFSVSDQSVLTFGYQEGTPVPDPGITTPPTDKTGAIGDTVNFSVVATNTDSYAWFVDDADQSNDSDTLALDTTGMSEGDSTVKVVCSNSGSNTAEASATLTLSAAAQADSFSLDIDSEDELFSDEVNIQQSEPVQQQNTITAEQALLNQLASVASSEAPDSLIEALDSAAAGRWFYRPFVTERVGEFSTQEALDFSNWCEANTRRCDFPTGSDSALDPTVVDDLISTLKLNGNRRTSIPFSKKTPTLSVRAGSYMSKTDYYALNGYIDAEFKKVGAEPEGLSPTQISIIKVKGGYYNVSVQSLASETAGMLRNTKTCSQYNESISQVEAIDAYVLGLQTELFNVLTSQDNFPQTYEGETLLINTADTFSDLFTTTKGNGFLGTRTVIHPVTGRSVVTDGYINVTKPEDIDKLTMAQRANNEAAPIILYLYPSGSVWAVRVKVNVIY